MRPVQGLAKALFALVAIGLVVQVTGVVLTFAGGSQGARLSFGIVAFLVAVPTIIVFCIWLHRILSNARDRAPTARIRPGWAVGSFFVPFVQLVAPYLEVRRGWDADTGRPSALLPLWFVAWSLSIVLSLVMGVVGGVTVGFELFSIEEDPGTPEYREAQREVEERAQARQRPWQVPAALLYVAAGVALILLAREWSALQEGRPAS